MPENAILFERGGPNPEVRLDARGFRRTGARSGGLDAGAVKVTLLRGAHLFRLHDGSSPSGKWWFSPFEYAAVAAHFGISGDAVVAGRSEGRSLLRAVLVLFSDWYRERSDELALYTLIRVEQPLYALYGAGDVGTGLERRGGDDAGTGRERDTRRTVTLPAAPIVREGRQSAVRQVYLPGLAACRASVTVLEASGLTDATLHERALALATRRLPFE